MVKKTKVWAHRGASGWDKQYAPENTMQAFQKALEMGADGIEFDVQLSRDGQLVVVHDERLERVSDGIGWIKDYTLQELKQMNFSKTHPEYGSVRIPTLEELLQWMSSNIMTMNIELKTGMIYYPDIEEKTAALVKQFEMQQRVLYSSFNHYSLKRLKELDKTVKIGLLCGEDFIDIPDYPRKLDAVAIHPPVTVVKQSGFIEKCHNENLSINVWTVDVKTDMKWMCEAGADAIFTDCPDCARKIADGDYSGIPK